MPFFQRTSVPLFTLFLAELGVITFARSNISPYLSPLLLLIFPIVFGVMGIIKGDTSLNHNEIHIPKYTGFILWGLALMLMGFIFSQVPISLVLSDTIPIMLSAVRKLLAGEFPYSPVNEGWGYTAFCTYMPMHWLPLTLPYSMGLEVRWIGVLFFIGAGFLLGGKKMQLSVLLPPLFLLIIPIHEFKMLGQTMELMIVAYYLFLIYALFSDKIGLQILAISLCLLSRYSLALWLPLWIGLMFFYDSKTKAMKLTGGIIASVLVVYILPFWSKDTTIFTQAMQYYDTSSAGIWQMMGEWQKPGEIPFILKGGGSLAIYFYQFMEGDIPHKLAFLKYTQLILSGLFILIALVAYPFFKQKISYKLYAIYCFPIYLGIFYAFMLVPFMYLQLVPCGVMMALLMANPNK